MTRRIIKLTGLFIALILAVQNTGFCAAEKAYTYLEVPGAEAELDVSSAAETGTTEIADAGTESAGMSYTWKESADTTDAGTESAGMPGTKTGYDEMTYAVAEPDESSATETGTAEMAYAETESAETLSLKTESAKTPSAGTESAKTLSLTTESAEMPSPEADSDAAPHALSVTSDTDSDPAATATSDTSDITGTAAASYTITYVLNDDESFPADNGAGRTEYTSADATFLLNKPVRSCYTFKGWYADSKFKKKVTKIRKGSRGDRILYAKWKANRYTVIFKSNGGKGKMKKMTVRCAKGLVLPACRYTYKKHTFTGWDITKNVVKDSCDHMPGDTLPAGYITKNGQKITLYARWDSNASGELYVSPDGDDGNDGTGERPYATIQHALDTATPGTVIHIRAGEYNEKITFPVSGEKTDPIVLTGEPYTRSDEDEWHLECPTKLTYPDGEESVTLIDLNGRSNIRIENLDIGNISAKYAYGIMITQKSRNIVIRDCRIHDIRVADPYLVSPEENEAGAGEANAILCLGEGRTKAKAIDNVRIINNEVCGNVTNWSESVSAAGNVSHIYVTGNQVHDNTNIGIDFNGNTGYCPKAKYDQPRYCRASDNTVYNCHCDYAYCAGIYADGARDTVLSNNVVHDCDYGMEVGAEEKKDKYPVRNITVSGNYLHDNSDGGLWIGGYDPKMSGLVKNVKVTGNRLKDNTSSEDGTGKDMAEIVINRCRSITFADNIIEKSYTSASSAPGSSDSGSVVSDQSVTEPGSGVLSAPLISSEMASKYTSKLRFRHNIYRTGLPSDRLLFVLFGREIVGVDAFNRATGGSDRAETVEP